MFADFQIGSFHCRSFPEKGKKFYRLWRHITLLQLPSWISLKKKPWEASTTYHPPSPTTPFDVRKLEKTYNGLQNK